VEIRRRDIGTSIQFGAVYRVFPDARNPSLRLPQRHMGERLYGRFPPACKDIHHDQDGQQGRQDGDDGSAA
jgi:hypothetical protein